MLQVNIFDPKEEVYEHFNSNVTDSRYIHWTIDLTYFPYIPLNDPPYFNSMLKRNIILDLDEVSSFSTGIPSNDTVWIDITWKPDYLENFMELKTDQDTLETTFKISPTDSSHEGSFEVSITLFDEDDPSPEATSYSFFVIVKHVVVFVPIIEEIIEEDSRVHPIMSYVSIEINGIVQFQFNEQMNVP